MEIRGRSYPEYVRPVVFFGLVLLLFTAVVVAYGFPEVEDEGGCYRQVNVCHGVPGESCLGIETSSLEEKQSCQYESQIKTLCRQERARACRNGTAPEQLIRGKDCSFWRDLYSMEKRSCSEIS
jgi:hypothetical protein